MYVRCVVAQLFTVCAARSFLTCIALVVSQVAAKVAERVLCMHGGLSPELITLSKINSIPRPANSPAPLYPSALSLRSIPPLYPSAIPQLHVAQRGAHVHTAGCPPWP